MSILSRHKTLDSDEPKMFPSGTLCMTIAANIGDVALLNFNACFPDSVVGFVPYATLNRDFLYYAFRCMKSELLRDAPVNTQGNLNVERIGVKGVPLPYIDEQQRIVEHIERGTWRFDQAIRSAERENDLLQEYRTRLIADVVTGKLDVREAAARLPDERDEVEEADNVELTDDDATMEEADEVASENDED